MLEFTKISYDQQIELKSWLSSLVPDEHYAALEQSLHEIIQIYCKSCNGNIVLFNEQLRKTVLPQIKATANNYLEKIALQKIIDAAQLPQPSLNFASLDKVDDFYAAIANYEYATINLPEISYLPKTLQVRRTYSHGQQIRLDLIKRIICLWHATEIALGPLPNGKMKKHFLDHIAAIQKLPVETLTSFNALQKIIKKYLQSLSWTVAEVVSRNLRIEPLDAQKLLAKMEGLANWERPRASTATVVCHEVAGKKHHHLQIDSPFKMELTLLQKKEYERITAKNVADRPHWFRALHPLEKKWLIKNKQKIIKGEINCPSSLTRHLPGVTNFSKFTDIIADENNQPISLHSSIRRHTLSLTVKNAEENERLTQYNGEQLFAHATAKENYIDYWGDLFSGPSVAKPKILFLDLGALTPLISGAASIVDLVPYQENNTFMQNANEAAIDYLARTVNKDVTVLGTNIAVNTEREYSENFIEYSFHQVTSKLNHYISNLCFALIQQNTMNKRLDTDLKKLQRLFVDTQINLTELKNIISSLKEQKNEIATCFFAGDLRKAHRFVLAFEALHDYLFITRNHARINDANNKALFAAALLQITVSHLGGTLTGGCKSAKDRWGTVLMQTSAMLSYRSKYHELPKVVDKGDKRSKFVKEFATVYRSGHQQHMASVNIYGANGTLDGTNPPTRILQKMGMAFIPMLPLDIQKEIGKERIETHQMFAKSSKWKFRDPNSYWKLFLYDLSTIFHTLTCGIFRKRRPLVNDIEQSDVITSKGSLAKLAKLCKSHDASLPAPEAIIAPPAHEVVHAQSSPVLNLPDITASTSTDIEQDRHLRARPLLVS